MRLAAGLVLLGLVTSSLRPMPAAAAARMVLPGGEQSYVSDQHGTASRVAYTSPDLLVSKIYCMGDSLTHAGVYETELLALLGPGWLTINQGISANTTADMLARFQTDVIDPGDAAYVIIWGGTVDIVLSMSAEWTEINLQAMYTMAHNAGIKVVAVTITPLNSESEPNKLKILTINAWIQNTATDVDFVADAYTAIDDPANPGNILPIYDSGDHAHLSDAGYAEVAATIYNAVTWTGQNQMLLTLLIRRLP